MAKRENIFNPRPYMELSIEEMNQSTNEPRSDGKVPPKVGAIILFPDGTIERAHRGELREGDHAEYTLIERKLGHKKLDDCILFTTLEPCVRRNSPKIECCRRVTNARIKEVYVGISDPDPTVDGKGIKHLEQHGVTVKLFDKDLQEKISSENKDFIDQAIERKYKTKAESAVEPFEKIQPESTLSVLSPQALSKFISEASIQFKYNSEDFKQYLVELGAAVIDEKTSELKATGYGILLFGKDPTVKFKNAAFKATAFIQNRKSETPDFDDPLVLLPDKIEEWLQKVLPAVSETKSFKRTEEYDYPIRILREGIINAIVHRDYSLSGAKSSIEIDHDKIVIKSPGKLLPSISIEQLNTFTAPSLSRNPIISYVFRKMKYVEERGLGMKRFLSLYTEFNLPLPEYRYEDPYLVLTLPRSFDTIRKSLKRPGISQLNDEELAGYEFIRVKRSVTRSEYEQHFKYDKKKAERHLTKMVELNLILRGGSGPGTFYEIIAT